MPTRHPKTFDPEMHQVYDRLMHDGALGAPALRPLWAGIDHKNDNHRQNHTFST